jgi:orotate phosphoribosyltransferase
MAEGEVTEYDDIDCIILAKQLLEDVGDNLIREHKQPKLLKVLAHRIENITRNSKDKRLLFLRFFLREYIGRIWTDMGIEVTAPIYEGYEIYNELFFDIGNGLANLADYLFNDKDIEYYKEFSSLIEIYERELKELNSRKCAKKRGKGKNKKKKGKVSIPPDFDSKKKEALELLQTANAIISKKKDFIILTGGVSSDFFIDTDKFMYDLSVLERTSSLYVDKIKKYDKINKLAFIGKENGPFAFIFLANTISQKSNLDFFIVDLKKSSNLGKIKGTDLSPEDRICIITDTTTSGDTVQNAANVIEEEGGDVICCITFFDRELGAKEYLNRRCINLNPILTQTDLEKCGLIGTIPKTGAKVSQIENAVIPLAKHKVEEYEQAYDSLLKNITKEGIYKDIFSEMMLLINKGDEGGHMQGI